MRIAFLEERQSPHSRTINIYRNDRAICKSGFVFQKRAHNNVTNDCRIDFVGTNLNHAQPSRSEARMNRAEAQIVRENHPPLCIAQSNSTSSLAFTAPIDDQ